MKRAVKSPGFNVNLCEFWSANPNRCQPVIDAVRKESNHLNQYLERLEKDGNTEPKNKSSEEKFVKNV